MAHFDTKQSNRSKHKAVVGHLKHYRHPTDKADNMAYYQNEKLDPLTRPTEEKVAPEDHKV